MFLPESPVYSCDAPLPEADHAGMSWVGSDLLVGQAAVEEGCLPDLWDDGSWLTCQRAPGGHLIATDPRGFRRIFLYRSGSKWAASTSFSRLVETVGRHRWPLTPRRFALNSWFLPEVEFHQAPFPETAAAEIRLLAHWEVLAIRDNQPVVLPRPAPGSPPADLDEVLRLWLGRLLTLLAHPDCRPVLELTGGLDSRTVLSLALHLRETGQVSDLAGLSIVSARGVASDYQIAEPMTRDLGLSLNPSSPRLVPLAAGFRFQRWRDISLGVAMPPYLLPERIDPALITIGGQGGEFLRLLSWAKDRSTLLALGRGIPGAVDRWRWRRCLSRAWSEAQGRELPVAPPDLQYRWAWRVRQFQGQLTEVLPRVTPLTGIGFRRWLSTQPRHWLSDGRVLFAIMERLSPGLARRPFAEEGYALPSDLASGGAPIIGTPGRVMGFPGTHPAPSPAEGPLVRQFAQAVGTAEAADAARLVGTGRITAARAALEDVGDAGLPPRAGFAAVHGVLLAGLLADAARRR